MSDGVAMMRNLLLWGVPFAVVVAALAYETDWGHDVTAETPPKAAAAPVMVSLLPEYRVAGGLDARKETVDRVLFNPTRRPAPPSLQAAASGGGSMQKGLYALTGTTVTGNVAAAFLREVKGGKSHTVHRGETLNGILVADVQAGAVRLKQGDEVEELQLKIASGPKTTVQIAPPAPPAPPAGAQPPGRPGVPAAAGGTGVAPNGNPAQPVAPPNVTNPAANNAARANGTVSVSEILAERRRAARAAAAAAAGNQAGVPRAR